MDCEDTLVEAVRSFPCLGRKLRSATSAFLTKGYGTPLVDAVAKYYTHAPGDVLYSKMIGWLRCRLSFALLRASIMSIRGARSSRHRPANTVLLEPVEVQVAEEGHILELNLI